MTSHPRTSWLRRLLAESRGLTLVEFAILLPVFVALVLGVMQLGQLFWTQSALQHAVEMAARCASINTTLCSTTTQVSAYAATQAYGLTLPAATFAATTPACGNEVTASYEFTFPMAALVSPTIILTARSCYPR